MDTKYIPGSAKNAALKKPLHMVLKESGQMMDYDTNMKNINWYPGHMKKTRELIAGKPQDWWIWFMEVVDARIPISSRNPIIDELVGWQGGGSSP